MKLTQQFPVPVIVLALLCLTFFSRLLLGTHVYFLDDLKIIYYPLEHAYAQFQHAGQLPHWSPLFGFGQPLLAWGQLGFFTPLHLLLRALYIPPLTLLQVSVVGYFAVGLAGFYLWMRRHGLGTWPAALGAGIYVFSGFSIGHLNHVNFYTATMLLPWLLLALRGVIARPSVRGCGWVALVASTAALSGQPQVVLYLFVMAALYTVVLLVGWAWQHRRQTVRDGHGVGLPTWLAARAGALLVAGAVAVCLASLAILPLYEFLPLTERADAVTEAELLEFSYPPRHAITLILPRFFGDHEQYWGAKNFQEIAGYVGIVPLLLAGAALVHWRGHRLLRSYGFALLGVGIAMGLGRYSPLYTYLVEHHWITSLNVPGRFIAFFDLGIAVLAAIGLQDLALASPVPAERMRQRWPHLRPYLAGVVIVLATLAPFLYAWFRRTTAVDPIRGQVLVPEAVLIGAGILLWVVTTIWSHSPHRSRLPAVYVVLSLITLLVYGWNYNPVTPRQFANIGSPFSDELASVRAETGQPARVYSRDMLLSDQVTDEVKATDAISMSFSIYQPLVMYDNTTTCLRLPLFVAASSAQPITVAITETLGGQSLETVPLRPEDIETIGDTTICFEVLRNSSGKRYYLAITSETNSGINLYYSPSAHSAENVYLVRVAAPTQLQLAASAKPGRLIVHQVYSGADREAAALARHLNVVADASSARWIGALSIRSYRAFIEYFFANDREQIDGEHQHFLEKYRAILNMAGVTHLIQGSPRGVDSAMDRAGFGLQSSAGLGPHELRLWSNPDAFPKVWLARNAIFEPVMENTFQAMEATNYDPTQLIYLSGPTPPHLPPIRTSPIQGQATITVYEPTRVEVAVNVDEAAWLVLNDAATPQWETYVDGEPAPYFAANTVFRTAHVPAGEHVVVWQYVSPATERAKKLSLVGIVALAVLWVIPLGQRWWHTRQPGTNV